MGAGAGILGAIGLANTMLGLATRPEQPQSDLERHKRQEALANKRKLQRERDSKREAEELEEARRERARKSDSLGGSGAGVPGRAAVSRRGLKQRLGQ